MMQTNADGVFAGGDVVVFPFPPRNNKKVNIPHWQMAHVHGRCCAAHVAYGLYNKGLKRLFFFYSQEGWQLWE